MPRLLLLAALLAAHFAVAQPPRVKDSHGLDCLPSEAASAGQTDALGDALPEGAAARLGTVRLLHPDAVHVSFSPDGRVLVSASPTAVRLWHVKTGAEFPWFLISQTAAVRIDNVRFSAAGKEVVADLNNGLKQRWELDTGKYLGNTLEVLGLNKNATPGEAVSPDGKLQARLERHRILLIETTTGRRLLDDPGHHDRVTHLALSGDGKELASAGAKQDNRLLIWDLAGKKLRRVTSGHAGEILCLAFAPDGQLALGEGSRSTDASDEKLRCIHLWDREGKLLRQMPAHKHGVYALAFAPDGKHCLSAGGDNRARLWQTDTWQEVREFTPRRPREPARTVNPWHVAFSPNGKILATCAGDDEEINLWDRDSGKSLMRMPRHWPLAFQPDGKTLLARNHFGYLSQRDVASGRELHLAKTRGDTLSPDGKTIVIPATDGNGFQLVDWATEQPLRELPGHRAPLSMAVFSRDGKTLTTGCKVGTILVWNLFPLPDVSVEKLWRLLQHEKDSEANKGIAALAGRPADAMLLIKAKAKRVGSKDLDVAKLIADLDDARFAVRTKASRQLEELGEVAEAPLQQALQNRPSLEGQRRMQKILEKLGPAPRSTPAERGALRLVALLERIATAEARQWLRDLADGIPQAPLTRAAEAALARLDKSD